MKKRIIVLFIIMVIVIILVTVFSFNMWYNTSSSITTDTLTERESLKIARQYVENSPTYQFDGIAKTLKHVETLTMRCPYCWQFTFTFDSRHAGYGDRTGQILAQVITPHSVSIAVDHGEVVNVVMDNTWDVMKQEIVGSKVLVLNQWVLTSFLKNGKQVMLPVNTEITIKFDDGRVSGSGGCNNYFGSYSISEDNMISIDRIAWTEMACLEGMEVEVLYFSALREVTTFQVTENILQLSTNDKETLLTFVVYVE